MKDYKKMKYINLYRPVSIISSSDGRFFLIKSNFFGKELVVSVNTSYWSRENSIIFMDGTEELFKENGYKTLCDRIPKDKMSLFKVKATCPITYYTSDIEFKHHLSIIHFYRGKNRHVNVLSKRFKRNLIKLQEGL